ncbi:unnamed protein product [Phytomonas sp. Hart1]|nr:unnamed protein product [Phytomonas sp. Hart1]|eukprot:CCW69125.1 unnamed protein product [Phytomonas sp. isolate Hart1]
MRPILPSCYLCGRQFGTTSIGIHVPQCYAKKLAQWEAGDPATRGTKPRHPDNVNWRGGPGVSIEEQSDIQFREFLINLEPCPNCGRRFLADRLVVHLRSCRPGNTSRPPVHSKRGGGLDSSTKNASTVITRLSSTGGYSSNSGAGSMNAELMKGDKSSTTDLKSRLTELSRTANGWGKLPDLFHKSQPTSEGRVCRHCSAVENDSGAKFCRECGWNLNTENMPNPCKRCGEIIPDKSRYCGTCGEPVVDATHTEREPGWGNDNALTMHMTTCSACKALCCNDANFCDNCGAALTEQTVLPAKNEGQAIPASRASKMGMVYCKTCDLFFEESHAVYCEDCGGKLVKRTESETSKNPDTTMGGTTRTFESLSSELPSKGILLPRMNTSSFTKERSSLTMDAMRAETASAPPTGRSDLELEEWNGSGEREECPSCGRQFSPEVLQKHMRKCATRKKKRPVFNINKKWLEGLDAVPSKSVGVSSSVRNKGAHAPPKKDWKAESEAFRRALREAKKVDQVLKSGGNIRDLPPPTYSENPDYVSCPHCQRRFAQKAAERHIPHCAVTMNKPKPPPKRRGV